MGTEGLLVTHGVKTAPFDLLTPHRAHTSETDVLFVGLLFNQALLWVALIRVSL